MSITKILATKDADAESQIAQIAEVVSKAREAYGNQDAEIAAPLVNTSNGRMSFVHLDAPSQIETLRGEIAVIKCQAIEFIECCPGANLNKKVVELLATNAFFTNIGNTTKFEYI
jgi:hypothetical protein